MNEGGPCKTPLTELLASVPEDARHMYEHHSTHYQNVPYGRLCRKALAEIERQRAEIEQWKDRLANVPEEYDRMRHEIAQQRKWLEQLLYTVDGDHMTACDKVMGDTHPCTCGAMEIRLRLAHQELTTKDLTTTAPTDDCDSGVYGIPDECRCGGQLIVTCIDCGTSYGSAN